jgi:hypothetical protein
MTGDLKIDLISGAYSKLRISGLTVIPSPEDTELALILLESMLDEYEARNICVNYKFEDEPDENSPSGVARKYWDAIKCNLAVRLIPDFGKGQRPDPVLITQGNAALSFLSSNTALVRQVQAPSRMPLGAGNRRYGRRGWSNYNIPVPEAPLNCETIKMIIGNVDDFVEHFDSYLNSGEDIDTYTIEADTGLTIVSDSNSSTDVLYRIKADGNSGTKSDSSLQLKIVVTTTDTRVVTRLINFELTEVEI